ncbi:MAG TPA: pitrilysin family protein, partial [Rhizobacter sp.]|nr:pitrilysin family protein [Rhizobacter sp.]
ARTHKTRLASGIELHTLNKQTRGSTVSMQVQMRWGDARATTLRLGTAMVGDLMLDGSQAMDKQRLRDELLRLKAGINIRSSNQGLTLYITAEKDTLIEALKLAAEVVQHPLFPADAFERIRLQRTQALSSSRQDLGQLRMAATREHFNAARGVKRGDPDYIPSLDESLDDLRRVTLDDVRGFYREFWSANDTRLAVVGAVPEGVEAAIESAFGAWKKPDAPAFQQYMSRAAKVPPARFDVQADDKTNAVVRVTNLFSLNRRASDYLPMMLAVHVLGGGSLESRLSTRVRRDMGLSYSVGASLTAPEFGDAGALLIDGSYAPQNRDAVIAAIQTELQRMGREGITPDELVRAKKSVLESWQQGRAGDAYLLNALNWFSEAGLDWRYEAEQETKLQALTVAQVNEAWGKLVDLNGSVVSTAGDFKAKAPQ